MKIQLNPHRHLFRILVFSGLAVMGLGIFGYQSSAAPLDSRVAALESQVANPTQVVQRLQDKLDSQA